MCSGPVNLQDSLEGLGVDCICPNSPKTSASKDGKSTEDIAEAGSHHLGRLFPRCVTLSNPLPPHRVIHIEGDNVYKLPDTGTEMCSTRGNWLSILFLYSVSFYTIQWAKSLCTLSRYRHLISQWLAHWSCGPRVQRPCPPHFYSSFSLLSLFLTITQPGGHSYAHCTDETLRLGW